MSDRVPVVILKFHYGSLGIARSLGRLGVPVYGVTADPTVAGLTSRYLRGRLVLDVEHGPAEQSVSSLLAFAKGLPSRPILIPVSDHATEFVAGNAQALRERFDFPELNLDLIRSLTSKKEMHHLAKSLSVPVPETLFPQSRGDVVSYLEGATFPVMLKGIDGARLEARTGVKMAIVRDPQELLARYDRMEDPASPNLMLQEYIPGGDDTVWMFNGYFNASSECLVGFTGKKIRQNPIYTGATSLGIVLDNPVVDETTRRFMKAVGYRGILDIGYRYDARDGGYKVLDVNPRIGATFRLFVGEDGLDVARALYMDLTGEPVPTSKPRLGRKWVVEDLDIESCLGYRRDGKLPLLEWVSSYRGVQEGAWFALDDPKPFLRILKALLKRLGRWITARLGMTGKAR